VPGTLNPADMPSRGLSASKLVAATSWWTGPEFLKESASSWPDKAIIVPQELQQMRKPARNQTMMTAAVPTTRLDPSNYSSWDRLVRVTAWCRRFATNIKRAVQRQAAVKESNDTANADITVSNDTTGTVPELTVDEVQAAERHWISVAQVGTTPVRTWYAHDITAEAPCNSTHHPSRG